MNLREINSFILQKLHYYCQLGTLFCKMSLDLVYNNISVYNSIKY